MRLRRRERKREQMDPMGIWQVFNNGTEYEFAECSLCGHEEQPVIIAGENITGVSKAYPKTCPQCGTSMGGEMTVEDVDAEAEKRQR